MTVKAIIPCAGYGTRMGMTPDQSKEMMFDPVTGDFLIDYSLNLCYKYNIEPVVISRIEKSVLNEYLDLQKVERIVLKKPGKEWAETVLTSQGLWGEKNILILPDTRFEPESVIPEMIEQLRTNEIVAAVHKIDPKESDKWGTVKGNSISEKVSNHQMYAWGLLGFDELAGASLFSNLTPGRTWFSELYETISKVELTSFKDITRSGTLEKY